MKPAIGTISGFVLGMAGFLLLYKVIVLDRTSPDDELAPGIVLMAAILIGASCAYLGGVIQGRLNAASRRH